jgi:hypothetical protein
MRDLLVAVRAGVRDGTKAAFLDAKLSGDLGYGAEEAGDLVGAGGSAEIGQADISALRNDKDMNRGLRPDVGEGQNEIVFIEFVAWNFAAQDAGEDVAVVIGCRRCCCHGVLLSLGKSWTPRLRGG